MVTNVRAARATAAFMGFQTAPETVRTNFASSGAMTLFAPKVPFAPGLLKSAEDWHTSPEAPEEAERIEIGSRVADSFEVYATEESVEFLLKSNWGTPSGGTFALEGPISDSRWLTLAFLENVSNAAGKLLRLRDAWFHRLTFRVAGPSGIVRVLAEYAAEVFSEGNLPVSGVVLPGSFTPNQNVFPVRTASLVRDPAGDAQDLRIYEAVLSLDQKLQQEWDPCRGVFSVTKTGRTEVQLEFRSILSDESWRLLEDSLKGTRQVFRLDLLAQAPSKRLRFDLAAADFEVEALGRNGLDQMFFRGRARAHLDGGDFVSISLT